MYGESVSGEEKTLAALEHRPCDKQIDEATFEVMNEDERKWDVFLVEKISQASPLPFFRRLYLPNFLRDEAFEALLNSK